MWKKKIEVSILLRNIFEISIAFNFDTLKLILDLEEPLFFQRRGVFSFSQGTWSLSSTLLGPPWSGWRRAEGRLSEVQSISDFSQEVSTHPHWMPGWALARVGQFYGRSERRTCVQVRFTTDLNLWSAAIWSPIIWFLFLVSSSDQIQEEREQRFSVGLLTHKAMVHSLGTLRNSPSCGLVGPYGEMGAPGSAYMDSLGYILI